MYHFVLQFKWNTKEMHKEFMKLFEKVSRPMQYMNFSKFSILKREKRNVSQISPNF